ncbi:MAG: hypothetical protein KGI08_00260 [Thaumarchaeota archaeon]|nr:hypothetical protein [Nitrososphaerota archaeon]
MKVTVSVCEKHQKALGYRKWIVVPDDVWKLIHEDKSFVLKIKQCNECEGGEQ